MLAEKSIPFEDMPHPVCYQLTIGNVIVITIKPARKSSDVPGTNLPLVRLDRLMKDQLRPIYKIETK